MQTVQEFSLRSVEIIIDLKLLLWKGAAPYQEISSLHCNKTREKNPGIFFEV